MLDYRKDPGGPRKLSYWAQSSHYPWTHTWSMLAKGPRPFVERPRVNKTLS